MPVFSQHNIDPAERISRYLYNQKLFNSRTGHIYPPAFQPTNPKKEGDIYKTSVYRTEGLNEAEVWTLGDDYVTKLHPDHLPILARADMQAQKVLDADLKIDPDGVPHQRHANIIGWPDNQEARQMKRLLLAQSALLVPRR